MLVLLIEHINLGIDGSCLPFVLVTSILGLFFLHRMFFLYALHLNDVFFFGYHFWSCINI